MFQYLFLFLVLLYNLDNSQPKIRRTMKINTIQEKEVNTLFSEIKSLVVTSRNKVYQTVNT